MTSHAPRKPSATSKTVVSAIDGLKIYAEAIGDPSKPAIIYIHGNSTSSGVWDNQFFDEALGDSFYQVRFDLRGHGLSETPDNDSESPYDNKKQASDVAAVLEEFSIKNPIFVAWSYGTLIPADYMSVHGHEGVRGVVVTDGLTGPPYVNQPDVHKFFTHKGFPGFTDNTDATKMHQAYGIFVRALTYRTWIFKRQKDWSVYMEKASQATPKLVIFGKEDGMNSLEYIDYIKTKWVPKLITSAIINEAGHAPFLEKPEEYNKILLDWAKSVARV
ncbi:AB hydrolase superfamily protein YdjP [Leucoagaricus sp. SymC.cos]|nr:AB hydrolase superfamily protein YdjP [Leucoagaricus sp. SymC.cos]